MNEIIEPRRLDKGPRILLIAEVNCERICPIKLPSKFSITH